MYSKKGICCEKLLQKGEGNSTFCANKIVKKTVHVALFTGPTQTCFPAGDVTPVYGVTLALFYPIRTQFHVTCSNLMCSKTCFPVGGQTRQH